MPTDRRHSPRTPVIWKAQIDRPCGAHHHASIANVSVDGLEMIVDRSLPVGETLQLALIIRQPGSASFIRLAGRVCHCRCLAANLGCTVGVALAPPPTLYRRQVEQRLESSAAALRMAADHRAG